MALTIHCPQCGGRLILERDEDPAYYRLNCYLCPFEKYIMDPKVAAQRALEHEEARQDAQNYVKGNKG